MKADNEKLNKEDDKIIKFDLGMALAGESVETLDGRKVTQLVKFDTDIGSILYGLDVENDSVECWLIDGRSNRPYDYESALCMSPKKLTGFVNIYAGEFQPTLHESKSLANTINNMSTVHRLALIDLSQFEEGYGI